MYPFRLPQGVARRMVCLLFVFSVFPLSSTVTAQTDSIRFRIGFMREVELGSSVIIPVTKEAGDLEISDFDFRIRFDHRYLTFNGVVRGQLFEPGGVTQWEDLSYSVDTTYAASGTEIQDVTLHVIGRSDIPNGHTPLSLSIPDSTVLHYLVFKVSESQAVQCKFLYFQFFWETCNDNTVTLVDYPTATAGVSRTVYFYEEYRIEDRTDNQQSLPTYTGLPQSCLVSGTPANAARVCDFDYSGIDIRCYDLIGQIGDVNVNGVPFEVADYVQFTGFFFNGTPFPEPFPDLRLKATDANQDGIPKQLEDLVYFLRVIVGDAEPLMSPQSPPLASIAFHDDVDAGQITFTYPGKICALFLKFLGEVQMSMSYADPDLTIPQVFDGEFTRVLIIPELFSPNVTDIEFSSADIGLSYTGDGHLIEADAADYYDHVFNVSSIDYSGKHAMFVQRYVQNAVEVYATEPLAAVEVRMEGSVIPTVLIPDVQWTYREEDGMTIISILPPPLGDAGFNNELIFSYSGDGKIVSTDAANALGEVVPSSFVIPDLFFTTNQIGVPSGYATIQEAIDHAADGDTVVVEPGTYTGPGNRDIDFLGKTIVLVGSAGADYTIIDCEGSAADPHRGIWFNGYTPGTYSIIEGFTITGGYAPVDSVGIEFVSVGGAIFCRTYGTLTVRNSILSNNHADDKGGAVYAVNVRIRLENTKIVSNTVSGGYGAGAFLEQQGFEIRDCLFEGNSTAGAGQETGYGGAIYCGNRLYSNIRNSVFSNNSSSYGGAIVFDGSAPHIKDNLFVSNFATIRGGAAYILDAPSARIENTTLVANSSPSGSAIASTTGFTLVSSIISDGELGPAVVGPIVNITCTDIHGNAGGDWTPNIASFASINGNISADPLFCDPVSGDWSVSVGSPCAETLNPCNFTTGAFGASCGYVCGDATDDARVDMADALFLANFIFRGGPEPPELSHGDANCDGHTNIVDVLHIVNFLFRDGPWPCCP
jgi:hypothetical protein